MVRACEDRKLAKSMTSFKEKEELGLSTRGWSLKESMGLRGLRDDGVTLCGQTSVKEKNG